LPILPNPELIPHDLKTKLIFVSFLLLSIIVLGAQPVSIDGHSHLGLYFEEGEIVLRTEKLVSKRFSGIFYALPVDRTQTEDLAGRLESEMSQIQKLVRKDSSLDIFFAVEFFEGTFSNPEKIVEVMAGMDIRYVTLIDKKGDGLFEEDLLTEKGRKVVNLLNQYDVTIDVSHLLEDQMLQVMEVSEKAIIASHSACREVTELERNLSDLVLHHIAESGGLVLISFNNVSLFKENVNREEGIKRLADHLMHAVEIAGVHHVGIGTDLQANGRYVPAQLWTSTTLQDIRDELALRGMGQADVERLFTGNLISFFELENP